MFESLHPDEITKTRSHPHIVRVVLYLQGGPELARRAPCKYKSVLGVARLVGFVISQSPPPRDHGAEGYLV